MDVQDHLMSRPATNAVIEEADAGFVSWRAVAIALLVYVSERDVKEVCQLNELLPNEDEQ